MNAGEHSYEVEIPAAGGHLRARHGDALLELPPIDGARHLDALRRHVTPGVEGLVLDERGYASEFLVAASVSAAQWSRWIPLVLWWAARPDLAEPATDGQWVTLPCSTRARLRSCTWRERISAARAGLVGQGDSACVDPVAVLEGILERVVADISLQGGEASLPTMDSASWSRLAGAALALTGHDADTDPRSAPVDPVHAQAVLELCRVLGCMPSDVLDAPACEIDVVWELLRHAGGEPRSPSVRGPARPHAPLHGAADAFVIDFSASGAS